MAQLFGNVGLVRLLVAIVASSPVVGRMVILGSDFAIVGGLEKESCAGGGGPQLGCLAISVQIAIVGAACAMRCKEIGTYLAVFGHDGGIEIGVDIISGMLIDIGCV